MNRAPRVKRIGEFYSVIQMPMQHAKRVKQRKVVRRVEQRLMIVLTVEIN